MHHFRNAHPRLFGLPLFFQVEKSFTLYSFIHSPSQGIIPGASDTTFEIHFCPKTVSDFGCTASLIIENVPLERDKAGTFSVVFLLCNLSQRITLP